MAGYPRLSGCLRVVPGLAPSGAAEFYRYRDDQGNYHVVDDPSAIPPAHVPGLKVYAESGADPAPTPPLPAPAPDAPAAGAMHPDEVVAIPRGRR
jgi:hypothetical protein